jgi:hypothetical protein
VVLFWCAAHDGVMGGSPAPSTQGKRRVCMATAHFGSACSRLGARAHGMRGQGYTCMHMLPRRGMQTTHTGAREPIGAPWKHRQLLGRACPGDGELRGQGWERMHVAHAGRACRHTHATVHARQSPTHPPCLLCAQPMGPCPPPHAWFDVPRHPPLVARAGDLAAGRNRASGGCLWPLPAAPAPDDARHPSIMSGGRGVCQSQALGPRDSAGQDSAPPRCNGTHASPRRDPVRSIGSMKGMQDMHGGTVLPRCAAGQQKKGGATPPPLAGTNGAAVACEGC